jgi:hypothetical protein
MTTQTHVWVSLREHLLIDGPMRRVTGRAAFAHRRMFEHNALGLFAMTRGALLVQSSHGEAARRFHDVKAVRVVTLPAIHFAFTHRMVLRKIELSVDFEVTREARLRIFAGIDDELSVSPADRHMFAARAVTRFATGTARHLRRLDVQSRVRTHGKNTRVLAVTIRARGIADESGPGNFRRRRHIRGNRGTGNQEKRQRHDAGGEYAPDRAPPSALRGARQIHFAGTEHGPVLIGWNDDGKYGFARFRGNCVDVKACREFSSSHEVIPLPRVRIGAGLYGVW